MSGVALAFLAACGWGVGAVLARVGLQHVASGPGTLLSLLSGFLLVWVLALAFNPGDLFTLSAVAIGWVALLGFVTYPIGRFFNYRGVLLAGVSRATPVVATNPLVATIWAVSLGGEEVAALTLLGSLLIVAGLFLILSESLP